MSRLCMCSPQLHLIPRSPWIPFVLLTLSLPITATGESNSPAAATVRSTGGKTLLSRTGLPVSGVTRLVTAKPITTRTVRCAPELCCAQIPYEIYPATPLRRAVQFVLQLPLPPKELTRMLTTSKLQSKNARWTIGFSDEPLATSHTAHLTANPTRPSTGPMLYNGAPYSAIGYRDLVALSSTQSVCN